jgi:glycosyltransferase involved in cell wall biosynthesis
MKILQLTHKPPVPSIDGGCLAMRQITSCLLSAGVEVKVVSISTAKHPVIDTEEFTNYKELTQFESVFVKTKIKIIKAFKFFFSKTSLQSDRFFSTEMVQLLETIFDRERFDAVILESIFVGHYIEIIRKYSQARILLRVHNIEHLIWKRLAKQTKNPVKKIAYKYLAKSLKHFELSLFHKIDGYLPITEIDHSFFKEKYPNLSSQVIPFAVNLSDYLISDHQIDENNISFFHIGGMNWQPNREGMTWFLDNIWEKVSVPSKMKLVLAGKGNQAAFGKKNLKNVQIFDFVENAQQFINDYDIMVVPLLSGSGMRVKIMEGMALGKPIITTTIGSEGIEITDKENIFIADTPDEMVQTMNYCATHTKKCEETGKNARKLIENKYTQEKIGKDLMKMLISFQIFH